MKMETVVKENNRLRSFYDKISKILENLEDSKVEKHKPLRIYCCGQYTGHVVYVSNEFLKKNKKEFIDLIKKDLNRDVRLDEVGNIRIKGKLMCSKYA